MHAERERENGKKDSAMLSVEHAPTVRSGEVVGTSPAVREVTAAAEIAMRRHLGSMQTWDRERIWLVTLPYAILGFEMSLRPPTRAMKLCALLAACLGIALVRYGWDFGALQALETVQRHSVAAPLVFLGCYALLVLLAAPTLPMNIGAGVLWGTLSGSALAVLGASLGAVAAFGCARALGGRLDAKGAAWPALEGWTGLRSWRLVLFLRLNPIFPFGWINYALGWSPISFGTYLWATVVGIALPSVGFAAFGSFVGEAALRGEAEGIVRSVLLTSAVFAVSWACARVWKVAPGSSAALDALRASRWGGVAWPRRH